MLRTILMMLAAVGLAACETTGMSPGTTIDASEAPPVSEIGAEGPFITP